jgi:hypothetical protein
VTGAAGIVEQRLPVLLRQSRARRDAEEERRKQKSPAFHGSGLFQRRGEEAKRKSNRVRDRKILSFNAASAPNVPPAKDACLKAPPFAAI